MAKLGEVLDEFVDPNLLECLNQASENPVGNAFKDGDDFLASDKDVDSELLVKVQFRQPVKLGGIRLVAGPGEGTAPKVVKVFQGKTNIGFAEAADEQPTQSFELAASSLQEGVPIALHYVKYQTVQSLQLFFPDPEAGNEQTQIKRIQFLGEPAAKMDMKDWKPVKG